MEAPPAVAEFAQTCVRYVQTSLGVALDFEPETLPLLDHYLRQAQKDALDRPETIPLLATVAGSYLGELLRRRHGGTWTVEGDDAETWSLQLLDAPVTVLPVVLAREAITGVADPELAPIQIADDLRQDVTDHLADLPDVSEEEFLSPSTRVEVIDIAVDLLRAHKAVRRGQALDGVAGVIEEALARKTSEPTSDGDQGPLPEEEEDDDPDADPSTRS